MKYEIGLCLSRKDELGRTESTVTIHENISKKFMGDCLCSCTFVGIDLDDAVKLVKKYFIKPLNEKNDRVSKVSH